MNESTKIPPMLIPYVLLLGAFICFQPVISAGVSASDEVKVIRNPKNPQSIPGLPAKVLLKEDLCIGRDAREGGYVFADIRAIQVDDEGDIIVLDWKDDVVKVFDSEGKFLRSFGKKGQGPGELQSPSRMSLQSGRDIAIMDSGNNRYCLYSKTGRCLKELNMGRFRIFRTIPDSRGYVYGDQLGFEEGPAAELIRIAPDFSSSEIITSYKFNASSGALAAVFDRLTYTVLPDDRFIWGRTSKYEIHMLGPEGKELMRIEKDYSAAALPQAEKKKILKEYPGVKESGLPAKYPPFYYLICDDRGRIYIRTYEKDDAGNMIYDIFDGEGRCFTRMALPETEMLFVVKKDKAYCLIKEDPLDGIPLVKRYALAWISD